MGEKRKEWERREIKTGDERRKRKRSEEKEKKEKIEEDGRETGVIK